MQRNSAADDNRKEEHASEWETSIDVEIRWGLLIGDIAVVCRRRAFSDGWNRPVDWDFVYAVSIRHMLYRRNPLQ